LRVGAPAPAKMPKSTTAVSAISRPPQSANCIAAYYYRLMTAADAGVVLWEAFLISVSGRRRPRCVQLVPCYPSDTHKQVYSNGLP
jgi:hypothetical protein